MQVIQAYQNRNRRSPLLQVRLYLADPPRRRIQQFMIGDHEVTDCLLLGLTSVHHLVADRSYRRLSFRACRRRRIADYRCHINRLARYLFRRRLHSPRWVP